MNITINDKLAEKFKDEIYKRKGMKKGNISNALEEAIQLWIETK